MKHKLMVLLITCVNILSVAHAGTIKVVTTTTDLKSIISVNCWSLILRISLIIILAAPNAVIVSILKIIENTDSHNRFQDEVDFTQMKVNKT